MLYQKTLQLEVHYTDYNMLPLCVEQADEIAFTLANLLNEGKYQNKKISISTSTESYRCK